MEISEILKQQKNFFKTKQTLPYSYRIGALKKLRAEIIKAQ